MGETAHPSNDTITMQLIVILNGRIKAFSWSQAVMKENI